MSSPGTLRFGQVGVKPSAPPVGYDLVYVKTDDVLYIQDSSGVEVALGSASAITQLTGDVSAIGPGIATATVNFVGGESAANVASATTAYLAATSSDTPSTLVLRDSSGNFSAGTITANLTGTATNATTTVNFTGSLSGDVIGTQSATVVAFVGGSSAANVHSAELAANAATPSNTASTLVLRDASGNFSANIITSALNGNAATSTFATNATTAVNFTGPLSGDVTGTQSATAIASTVVTGKLLTTYSVGANTPISATDSILTAFEKVQGQISATSGSAITALTGDVSATGPGSAIATVVAIQGHSVSTTAPTDAQILIYNNTSSKYVPESISGDISLTDAGVATLATVNSNVGSFGSSTVIPSFTVNGKGLITSASTNAVVAPAGTLTGTTLASNVISSSLTSVGTISTGVWNGTPLTAPYMLALPTADIYVGNGSNQPAAVTMSGDINIVSSGTATIQPNVVSNSKLAQAPTDTLKGNNTGSTANVTDLTVSQINTMLGTITTVGVYDSQASQANALDIVGNTLYAQSATTTNPGMVNATTQSFAGNKTFTGTVAISPSSISSLTIDTTAFIFDSTNDVLGIGLQPSTSVMIDGINTTGASKLVQMTGYGVGSTTGYRGRFARGTSSSPTAVQSGDVLSAISGRGYGASQFAAASTGVINIVAGETFSNTSNLTYLQFSTTPTGSITSAEAMRVATTGITLGPQSASTAIHQINGGENLTTNTIASSTYSVDSVTTDYIIYTNSTSNAITITLPAPTNGRLLIIEDKAGTAATNNITIDPHASEKINGASSFVISQNYGSMRITSDGTNWFVQNIAPNVSSTIQPVIALTESGGATTINWAAGNMFTLTLNANLTISFSNQTAGQTIVVRLTNTASNYTVTWPTIKWPVQTTPVMTVGAFSDVYTLIYDGSNTYGSYVQNF